MIQIESLERVQSIVPKKKLGFNHTDDQEVRDLARGTHSQEVLYFPGGVARHKHHAILRGWLICLAVLCHAGVVLRSIVPGPRLSSCDHSIEHRHNVHGRDVLDAFTDRQNGKAGSGLPYVLLLQLLFPTQNSGSGCFGLGLRNHAFALIQDRQASVG